ncbi:MAG: hypothetical protein M1415_00395 [Firmicutes bacterium]|jgi:hypothetical protein|nr:hypothetical protein [Bacillota bacterium]MCL5063824.1 hypothetical protein [Bacillota bacterium]
MNARQAILDVNESDNERLLSTSLPCIECGQEFSYRYVGTFHEQWLQPVERVCRDCLPEWYGRWALAHGWA